MSKPNKAENLRKEAEKVLANLNDDQIISSQETVSDIKKLLHELQVHQIEIEMQNEELMKMQEELTYQKNKYSDLYDFAPVGYIVMDKNGKILDTNQSFCIMLGIPKSQMTTMNISQMLHYFSKDTFYFHLQSLKENEQNQVCQLRLKHNPKTSEEEFWIKMESKIIESDPNKITIRSTISDISKSKKNEEHLLRLTKAFEQSSNSIIITDTEGIIEYVNPRFYEVTGFAPHEVIGQNPRIIKYENSVIDYNNLWQTILSGNTWRGEFLNKTRMGEKFWELATITPVKNNEGNIINFLAIKEDITLRKLSEEKLQKAKEFYLKLLQDFPVMIWQCDYKGEFNYFNNTFRDFTGIEDKELLNMDYTDIIHPQDVPIFVDAFTRSLESKTSFVVEYRIKDQFNNYRWVMNHGRPFTNVEGKYGGFISTCIDIHERNMFEQRLIESEEKYRRMFEDSSLGIFKLDRNFTFISANKSFAAMFDYESPVDFLIELNNNPSRFFPDFAGEWGFIKELIKSKQDRFKIERELLKKDGKRIQTYIHLRKVNERNSGKEFYIEGFVEDITIRKATERKLLLSEQKFKALFEKSYEPILILDKNKIIDCNRKACELFNMSRQQILDKDYLFFSAAKQYKNADAAELFKEKIQKVRDGEPQNFDWIHVRDNQKFDAEVSLARIYVNNKRRVQAIIRDVSEKRLAEKQLKKAKEDAEKARKAQSEFLSLMSHEIRTPLNAVVSLTDLMLHENLNVDQLENLDTIKFSARHLLGVIDDILDYNKIESGNIEFDYEDFDLRQLIKDLYKTLEIKAQQKNLELIIDIDEKIPSILRTDTLRLEQVLYNMLSNAIKFTPSGFVSLKIEKKSDEPGDSNILFEVKDTGIGIAEDRLDAIFEKFTQAEVSTSRKYGGSGLGLSICKKLIELQGGTISAKSKPGKGSVFTFMLEMKPGENKIATKKESKRKDNEKTLKGVKILLVEDDKMNQFVGRKVVQHKWEADLTIKESGEEALEDIEKNSYDIVLMDLLMPGIDGYEATRMIRKNAEGKYKNPGVPIIALTADAFLETRKKAFKAGVNDFVTKPFDYPKLLNTLLKYKPE